MALTTAGKNAFAQMLAGAAVNAMDATNGHLGVGDSSAAFAVGQTDLQAATNKHREILDAAPGVSGNVVTFVATFEGADANHAWNELGGFNAATGGTMFFRKVAAHGVKASGDVWELTCAVTVG